MANEINGYEVGVWYVKETTEGETPTNATYLHLAHKTEVKVADAPGPIPVALSGSVDNASIEKGITKPITTMTLTPSKGSGKDFLKEFSSTDDSFTLLVMKDAPTDTVFARIPGCKVKRSTPSTSIYPQHAVLQLTLEIHGFDLLFTQSGGTPTFESPPSTAVNWSDVVIKKNTSVVTDWWDAEFTIDNELERMLDDDGDTVAIKRGRRAVTGVWTRTAGTDRIGETEFGETKLATDVDLEIIIDGDIYAFNNSAFEETDVTHALGSMVGIRSTFVAETLTLPT
ncbi:MAG: hypothetical protein O6761_07795 [Thaumarchaeota archaeon]|nr:hypothetical protein [Nitrososphaerota archaeon]